MNIGENIRKFRIEKGMSQEELGKRINVSQNDIHLWEKTNNNITVETIEKVAIGLEVSTAELLGQEEKAVSLWTPITDGLPPVGMPLIVTIFDTFKNRKELRYPVYYQQGFFSVNYGFYLYGSADNLLLPEYSEVLAWCKFPQVYESEE